MHLPRLIREALDADPNPSALPGTPLTDGEDCQGAKHHSPRPLLLHDTHLVDGRNVRLCGTCQDNLAVLEHLNGAHKGVLPWPLRREFGNQVRALAGC